MHTGDFYLGFLTMKNDGCSWCASCCFSILCPPKWCCSNPAEYWRILESLFALSRLFCSLENSSSSRKKMVFLNGNIVFKVLMGMLLKVLIDIFRKFSHFLADQNSWKCQVYLQLQWLIFPFAGNTVHISTGEITNSRNRIKPNLSKRVALIFYIQMPLFQPDLWFACSALNPRNP